VEACYIDLLSNSPAPCVALVARALPTELSSVHLPRLIATAGSTLTLFAMNGTLSLSLSPHTHTLLHWYSATSADH
jgi:hypothetical protein